MHLTPERLTAYLAKRFGDDAVEARGVMRLPGGFSKETWLFERCAPGAAPEPLVMRCDLPAGPTETSVRDEFPLLGGLHAAGFPVAEPRWLEDDPSALGQAFVVVRRVEGSSDPASWGDDRARRRVGEQMADLLARLHRLAPGDLELGISRAPRDADECAAQLLDPWHDLWRRKRLEPSPGLARAFAWLRAHRPREVERIGLVHTDVGTHNLLVHEGEVRALVDWEFAHFGDPSEDLAYARPYVEALMPWPDFLARYTAAGGPQYRAENARFYEVWRSVRNAVACTAGLHAFCTGANREPHMALVGVGLYRRFLGEAVRRIGD